jgi:hypothetical protein
MTTVYILDKTEYEGQCTGFSEYTELVAIFTEKPDLQGLSPFLVGFLSNDMAEAIPQVLEIINKGHSTLRSQYFSLYQVKTGKKLNN